MTSPVLLERLLTRLKYPLPLFSLLSLQILRVGRPRLRDPLPSPGDRFYRRQREELERVLDRYHVYPERTIPMDCAILTFTMNGAAKKRSIYYISTVMYYVRSNIVTSPYLLPSTIFPLSSQRVQYLISSVEQEVHHSVIV
jgi:hypothetical protein